MNEWIDLFVRQVRPLPQVLDPGTNAFGAVRIGRESLFDVHVDPQVVAEPAVERAVSDAGTLDLSGEIRRRRP
jgi:hypothetical protein